MKSIWSSESLSKALGVDVPQGLNAETVQFNSKDVSLGDLFIALKGARDGHEYVMDALERGAACAIVSAEIPGAPHDKLIFVEDTYKALYALAAYKRKTVQATFIGITGSVGKTSTKEIIFGIAKHFGSAFASRTNFNNHIGLPLNLASMPDDTEYGIFELGMDAPGEILELSRFLRPDISVITNISLVHLANFNSLDEIAKAKCEIFDGMNEDGVAIFNADDKYYDYFIERAGSLSWTTFGESDRAMSQLRNYKFDGHLAHVEFKLDEEIYSLQTTLGGHHMARNLACGLIVAKALNFDTTKTLQAMSQLKPVRGRGEQIGLTLSGYKCLLIHDCYNAGPASVSASLKHLGEINHKRKMAILADMRDLGPQEKKYHRELAEYVMNAGVERLYTVGALMHELHKELKGKIEARHFENSAQLKQEIIGLIDSDMMILMKGSNSTGLLAVADYLIKEGKEG